MFSPHVWKRIAQRSPTPHLAASSTLSRWRFSSYQLEGNRLRARSGHSSMAACRRYPESSRIGPTLGCSITAATTATWRRSYRGCRPTYTTGSMESFGPASRHRLARNVPVPVRNARETWRTGVGCGCRARRKTVEARPMGSFVRSLTSRRAAPRVPGALPSTSSIVAPT
jgi:hypothetical protein